MQIERFLWNLKKIKVKQKWAKMISAIRGYNFTLKTLPNEVIICICSNLSKPELIKVS